MAVAAACTALANALSSKLVFPTSDIYKDSTTSYCTAFENDLLPACVVKPTSKGHVEDTLKTIKPFNHRNEVQLAIRAGGNQPFAVAANIAKGATIDLRSLTGINISTDKTCVSLAAGESWGHVYAYLAATGLAVAGGRSSPGGIGGLALGGGISFFSSRKRFVSDNIVNFELVLASGDTVNANANEDKDLRMALKGGSNNFGIVTRFDMTTFEQGKLWGGDVYYGTDLFPEQVQALADYAMDQSADGYAYILLSVCYAVRRNDGQKLRVSHKTSGESADAPALVSMRPQIEALTTLRLDTIKGIADEQAKGSPPGQRLIYMTSTINTNADDQFNKSIEPLKSTAGLIYLLSYQPLTTALLANSATRGPNSFGLDLKDGPLMVILLAGSWTNAEDDQTIINAQRAFINEVD